MFWLFSKRDKESEYIIKHFPKTWVYVVMYKGNYLETNPSTWFIREWSYPELWWEHTAESFYSEKAARDYIQKHKEQTTEYEIIYP